MKTEFGNSHLTYCTNIHPGETWQQVRENLERHLPPIKAALQVDEFGIGLRLSGQACYTLKEPEHLAEFKDYLQSSNNYVFTLNGFPYGTFHGTRVKEDVYLPDWLDSERLAYTCELANVLSALLPEDMAGSISTVPGAFKASINSPSDVSAMASAMIQAISHLITLERQTGKTLTLALEPEPCCFLETIDETVAFYNDHLLHTDRLTQLAKDASIDSSQAERLIRRHLSVCLDLCHAAVEFEDPNESIDLLEREGIEIGKLQISSGLRMSNISRERAEQLRVFDDATYLHQVVEQRGNEINRYPDLEDAFASIDDATTGAEWRIHCHVPLFHDDFGEFSSTQFFVRDVLARHLKKPVSAHLEVETYTWNVLPREYRGDDINVAVARELDWVRQQWHG